MDEVAARTLVQAMCDRIAYRGPDDAGYYADGDVALGMRRLSIIDLKTGHQPMFADRDNLVIVYNGEVYNYAALREQLRVMGSHFATTSDTEVVLRMFEQHGSEAFGQLDGMFGIALYDRRARRLTLCRDPVGIKPLYYYWDGELLVFASEIKAILAHPGVRRELNMQAVWDYLTYEYVPGPGTMFQNLFKLSPGHYLELDVEGGEPRIIPYRDYPVSAPSEVSGIKAEETFAQLFSEVVGRQMVADVPVGVFLSAGLDSSAVCVAAQPWARGRLKTFCIGFEERTLTDETVYARQLAAHLKTDHHEYITNAREYLGFVDEFVRMMDEPNADMAGIGKYFASRLAAQHVKVVLSGEGGDEMLAGYRLNEAMARFDQLARLQRLPQRWFCDLPSSALFLVSAVHTARRLRGLFVPAQERGAYTLPSMTRRFSEGEKRQLFSTPPDMQDSLRVLRHQFARARELGPLGQIQYAWSKQWLAEHLLMQADRMSMCCSLELRVPLLDNRLADFLFRLPDGCKIRKVDGRYQTKYLLRRFLNGRVPDVVLQRPKRGFQIPNLRFISQDLRPDIVESLTGQSSRTAAWFDPKVVRAWLARAADPRDEYACQRVWILYILERWCRQWL